MKILITNKVKPGEVPFIVSTVWDIEHLRDGKLISFELHRRNIVVNEGLNKLLNIMFHAATQITTWYIGLFESDTNPAATTSYATPVFTECTAYAEATRQEYNEAAATGQSMTNSANKATFSISTTKTIYGGFLSNVTTKGDTVDASGVIYCAAKFGASLNAVNGDSVKITLTLTAADS